MGAVNAKAVLARGVKTLAVTADRVRGPRRGVVVLIYHRVGAGSGLQVDLPVDLFAAQMEVLAAEGRVVTLDEGLAALDAPGAPPGPDPVVITFDDGTADFAEHAMPVLERHRVPATLYVATSFVEDQQPFPADGTPLSWSALRDALTTGLVTVGSHTHTHALLDRAAPELVDDELTRSVELIGERLGVTAEHFAYPKANAGSPAAERAVRARFRSAALAGTRPNPYGRTDPYRLARSPIQVADAMEWFRRKSEGGMALEDTLRRLLNRRRYAGATT
jgi:peptidoglycan/xylan/chitin deacetylase (PgdA/CDA1 family)